MEISTVTNRVAQCTHPDIKCLESVARCCSQGHHLWTCVGDAYLEVTIGILLLENDADGFLHVN